QKITQEFMLKEFINCGELGLVQATYYTSKLGEKILLAIKYFFIVLRSIFHEKLKFAQKWNIGDSGLPLRRGLSLNTKFF
ncbi:hypothetical protein ACR2U3_27805, partial [Klebsiella pneumoniae]